MKKFLFILCFITLVGVAYGYVNKELVIQSDESIGTGSEFIQYTVDGEVGVITEVPEKDSGYEINSVECTNGTEAVWDNEIWGLRISNISSESTCVIDFIKIPSSVAFIDNGVYL